MVTFGRLYHRNVVAQPTSLILSWFFIIIKFIKMLYYVIYINQQEGDILEEEFKVGRYACKFR